MASTVWKGHLTVGLVTIPVRLGVAASSDSLSFHMLHEDCKSRVKQKLFCETCNREVERAKTIKGFEEGKDQYLIIAPAEIESIAPGSSTTMEVSQFVDAEEVDPVYLESSYYLEPEKVGRAAYRLLMEGMRRTNRVAIAKLAMRQREHIVLIRPHGPGLILHTLYYEGEVRAQELNLSDVEVTKDHLNLIEQLIESMRAAFDPRQFRDEYQARLVQLLESKRAGQPLLVTAPPRAAAVVDITEALKMSLMKKPPASAAAAQTPAALEAKPRKRAVGGR